VNQESNTKELENTGLQIVKFKEVSVSCPYFKEGYFGICVAPDAIHVPSIAEIETFCFRVFYESCPKFRGNKQDIKTGEALSPKSHLADDG